jgi:hypothetical protein
MDESLSFPTLDVAFSVTDDNSLLVGDHDEQETLYSLQISA